MKQLSDACNKWGVKFCIYYSILDWYHPEYPVRNPHSNETKPNADMSKYLVYMKNQLKELATNYKPYMLWFDGGWESPWTEKMGTEIYSYLKALDQNLLVNNRLDKKMGGLQPSNVPFTIGDFDTPEQRVGNINMTTPWESCITIAEQWAWKANDRVKSIQACIQTLILSAAGNGNLLFNIGPMMDGRIETRQQDVLAQMGTWLSKYGNAIYGTKGGAYYPTTTYASTRKVNSIQLPNLPDVKIRNTYFINGQKVFYRQTSEGIRLELPAALPDTVSSVLVLELNKNAEAIPLIKQ